MTSNPETGAGDGPDCLFCRVAGGQVPAQLLAQDERVVAFLDIAPQAPLHALVVPRAHHSDVAALVRDDPDALVALTRMAAAVAAEHADGQFRLVFNTGARAGQTVDHVHAHVLGGRALDWPPG